MKKTVMIDCLKRTGDAAKALLDSLIAPFVEVFSAEEENTGNEELQVYGNVSRNPDDTAAVLWYAVELEKAERAYDEHMEGLCTAISQMADINMLPKIMESHTDKYSFIGSKLHKAISRAHYPWISVQDIKPCEVGLDWVQVQTMMLPECYWGVPESAEMRDGKWYTMDDIPMEENEGVIVTHWRPLPAPPQNDIAPKNIIERMKTNERS